MSDWQIHLICMAFSARPDQLDFENTFDKYMEVLEKEKGDENLSLLFER